MISLPKKSSLTPEALTLTVESVVIVQLKKCPDGATAVKVVCAKAVLMPNVANSKEAIHNTILFILSEFV